jgi:hypothetical protein
MQLTIKLGTYSRWLSSILLFLASLSLHAENDPKYYAVMTHAEVTTAPPAITLKWNSDQYATGYSIARRSGNSWNTVASVGGSTHSWTDSNVSVGQSYEYRITKTTSRGYKGASFLLAGINAPLKDNLGKVILVVDNTYASQLNAELQRLEWDLAGDGWTVLRRNVSRSDSVTSVKQVIRDAYNSDPANVKAAFLFGHVPVPYSGNLAPDGHGDHVGAWTADLYYGDMDGGWSDSSVNNTGAHKPWNHNRPGDGKFDQSNMPSDVEIAVGRVDFHNMTCYANKTPARSELDLLRAYLNKDHNFRHRVFTVARRGLVCDNFGERDGEAFAASGWRNFGAFFGADNVTKVSYGNYFSTLASQDYLWSYGTGGGSWYSCNGIGTSDDFATTEIRSVFTMFLGSYFGDWDNESAFLRAALGSGYALTTSWAGRPHWFYHQMGLGEPIAVSTVASQNNVYGPAIDGSGWYSRQVHAALLGDPTLRMHPVIPPGNLRGTSSGGTMQLTWNGSTDSNLQGYHVYRGYGPASGFTRLTSSPVSNTSFTDSNYSSGAVYMVRAIKLEQSGSGTYYNASQGAFFPENSGGGEPTLQIPAPASDLSAGATSASQINLSWSDKSNNETGFRIDRRTGSAGTWSQLATVGANTTTYINTGLSPGLTYYYRVVAFNNSGAAMPSNESSATTSSPNATSPGATFAATDTSTSGNWRNVFGRDGFNIPTSGVSLPGYATMNVSGGAPYQWSDWNQETRALQNAANNGRVASCWFADESFTVDFNFLDGQTHLLSLYFCDWDRSNRSQRIEILDGASGAVLDTRNISSFQNGLYLSWNVKGSIRVRVTKTAGNNAVLNGIFFDPPTGSAGGSTGSPINGGLIAGKFNLKIEGSIGQKFDIYYTENLTTWTKLTNITLVAPILDFLDTTASGRPQRFYRAAALP